MHPFTCHPCYRPCACEFQTSCMTCARPNVTPPSPPGDHPRRLPRRLPRRMPHAAAVPPETAAARPAAGGSGASSRHRCCRGCRCRCRCVWKAGGRLGRGRRGWLHRRPPSRAPVQVRRRERRSRTWVLSGQSSRAHAAAVRLEHMKQCSTRAHACVVTLSSAFWRPSPLVPTFAIAPPSCCLTPSH